MTKKTLNSVLHAAIKQASNAQLDEAHDMLLDLESPFHHKEDAEPHEHLVYVALSTAASHLWEELLLRQTRNYGRSGKASQSATERWVRQLDDRSLEQQYMREHRHVLMYRHELNREDRFIPEDETESALTHEELFNALTAEIERRGLREQFANNQELRNTNFNPDDEQYKARLKHDTARFLSGIAPDMWGETLRLCERDVEIAMETGELALIEQERHILDAVRDHIRDNNIQLSVTEHQP